MHVKTIDSKYFTELIQLNHVKIENLHLNDNWHAFKLWSRGEKFYTSFTFYSNNVTYSSYSGFYVVTDKTTQIIPCNHYMPFSYCNYVPLLTVMLQEGQHHYSDTEWWWHMVGRHTGWQHWLVPCQLC